MTEKLLMTIFLESDSLPFKGNPNERSRKHLSRDKQTSGKKFSIWQAVNLQIIFFSIFLFLDKTPEIEFGPPVFFDSCWAQSLGL